MTVYSNSSAYFCTGPGRLQRYRVKLRVLYVHLYCEGHAIVFKLAVLKVGNRVCSKTKMVAKLPVEKEVARSFRFQSVRTAHTVSDSARRARM